MKKPISYILIISLAVASVLGLSGCWQNGSQSEPSALSVTENESVSRLDIYPESAGFKTVGRFSRAAYGKLNPTQKQLFILLDNAVYEMKDGYIKLGQVEEGDVSVAFEALRQDRPEYFWLPISYTLRTVGNEKQISFSDDGKGWLYNRDGRKKYENDIKAVLKNYLSTADVEATEYERELSAHDFLAEMIQYSQVSLNDYKKYASSWNIVGAFCEGKAVCEGYSRAMQVMCFMLGLDCSLVTGDTGEPHMWNTVKIDGDWYHLDLTANDSDRGPYHFFFNVTEKYLADSRTVYPERTGNQSDIGGYNIFLPNSVSEKYNYHIYESLYIAEESQAEPMIVSTVCEARKNGEKAVELAASDDVGFSSKHQTAEDFFRLERCISIANSELPKDKRIRKYTSVSVEGAKGFVIFW